LVIYKWLSITTSSPTSTCENTGRETYASGSTKQVANTEDFKPEEPKLPLSPPDPLIDLDLQSDARLLDITTDPESERDSPLLRSDRLVLESSSPNLLESLLTTEERTEVRKDSKPTKFV
jgi:hypothetical protein